MMKKTLLALCALTVLSGCCNKKWSRGCYGSHSQRLATGETVWFELNSAALSHDATSTLQKQAEWLNSNTSAKAKIEGHADERGTREYNIALGEKRAMAVKHFLVKQGGVAADRLSTISYGKEKPAVLGNDESAWSKNRRSEIVVSGK